MSMGSFRQRVGGVGGTRFLLHMSGDKIDVATTYIWYYLLECIPSVHPISKSPMVSLRFKFPRITTTANHAAFFLYHLLFLIEAGAAALHRF